MILKITLRTSYDPSRVNSILKMPIRKMHQRNFRFQWWGDDGWAGGMIVGRRGKVRWQGGGGFGKNGPRGNLEMIIYK